MIRNLLLICCILLSCSASAQYYRTVTYKPNAAKGKDATISNSRGCIWPGRTSANENLNFGNDAQLPYLAWRFDSLGCFDDNWSRSLIQFTDFDTIPRTRTKIISAQLRLYGINPDGWYGFNHYPGSPRPNPNPGWVSMIVSPWTESTVTWNTQPFVTTDLRQPLNMSDMRFNFNDTVDVTRMADSMFRTTNYGFCLSLQSDTSYRSALFASSDYADTTLWPELIVTYADSGCVDAKFSFTRINCFTYEFNDISDTVPFIGVSSYLWDLGDGKISFEKNPRDTFPGYGTYTIKMTARDLAGCLDTTSAIITINPPAADWVVSDTGICNTGGTASMALHANAGASTYQWSPAGSFDTPNAPDATVTLSRSDTVYLTISDADGCTATDTVRIALNTAKPLSLNLHDITGCMGDSVQLLASGAKHYRWSPERKGLSNDTLPNPLLLIPGTIQYTLSTLDSSGCANSDTVRVTQLPTPILTVTSDNPAIDCGHDYVQLHVRGAKYVTWEPANYFSDNKAADPIVSPSEKTVFLVTGVNEQGCAGRSAVLVDYKGRTVVVVPNAFSPNGDGRNDVLLPIIKCDFRLQDFTVFDRWGNTVFKTYDIDRGWDGSFNGEKCSSGTYYYMLRGRDHDNKDVLQKGNITLLR